ncbi:MFS transporter [uncultured Chloroflexus sp.]|uniref:MFS transporter n=1 Tax=uncultured Chloroflexus sp. TaxID=214040 RepID=UPI00261BC1D6|nr:MFS transporter [uncultured Chloroflexus sp.]
MRPLISRAELRALVRPTDVTERNIRNVLIDGIGVGIVTGVSVFLPVFLVRLGASSLLVGMITSLPALAGALFALPIGRFLERQSNIVVWYSGMRFWVLASYAVFGLLPFILPLTAVPWMIIIIWALVTIPSTFVNVAFTIVMGSVAGLQRRYALMSMRWSMLGLATAVTVALIGRVLDQIPFPLNYQVVFIGSVAGGLLSFFFSRAITLPERTPIATQRGDNSLLVALKQAPPAFMHYAWSAFVFRSGVAMAIPLLPLYYVRETGLNDSWIGLISMVGNGVLLVAYAVWSAAAPRLGNSGVLLASSLGMALYPFGVALTDSPWLLAVLAGLVTFCVAGNDLVNFDLVLSTIPAERQATYVGLFQTLQNLALFVMPLVATLFADVIGIVPMLLVAGVIRLLGVTLFALLRVGK